VTPIEQLRATKKVLPPELREAILTLGSVAVPPLIEMLLDDELGMAESPAEGWPPIHAVELLADLKAPPLSIVDSRLTKSSRSARPSDGSGTTTAT
jgi:hypothetical protein